MIFLALIPAFALLAIVVLCLRAKHSYSQTCERIQQKAEAQRQEKLAQDTANDQALIENVYAEDQGIGELLNDFRTERQAILPSQRKSDPAMWTNDDLLNYLKRWKFSLSTREGRKMLFHTGFRILGVIAVAGTLAAWCYSRLSSHPISPRQNATTTSTADPFASFGNQNN